MYSFLLTCFVQKSQGHHSDSYSPAVPHSVLVEICMHVLHKLIFASSIIPCLILKCYYLSFMQNLCVYNYHGSLKNTRFSSMIVLICFKSLVSKMLTNTFTFMQEFTYLILTVNTSHLQWVRTCSCIISWWMLTRHCTYVNSVCL